MDVIRVFWYWCLRFLLCVAVLSRRSLRQVLQQSISFTFSLLVQMRYYLLPLAVYELLLDWWLYYYSFPAERTLSVVPGEMLADQTANQGPSSCGCYSYWFWKRFHMCWGTSFVSSITLTFFCFCIFQYIMCLCRPRILIGFAVSSAPVTKM